MPIEPFCLLCREYFRKESEFIMDRTVRISAPNKITILNEKVAIIRITKQDGKLVDFLIDRADISIVEIHRWFSHNGYACRIKNGRFWYLTWELLGRPPKGFVLHHVNENRGDNRRCNLALIPQWMNNYLKGVQENKTTKRRGVYLYADGSIVALIGHGGQRKSYKTLEDAIEAREAFEKAIMDQLVA
jgi:hypothetical protein